MLGYAYDRSNTRSSVGIEDDSFENTVMDH